MIKCENGAENKIPELEIRCPFCGEILGEDKSFCHKCGKYLGTNSKTYQPISEKKAQTIKWVIGAVAVIIFIVIYVFLRK